MRAGFNGCVPILFSLISSGIVFACMASASNQEPLPKRMPTAIVDVWKKTGAEVGWIRVHESGYREFVNRSEGEPGDTPAFLVFDWDLPLARKLPDPAIPFGLRFGRLQLTDSDLQGLIPFKNLHTLDLGSDKITDEGLKHLAGLKSLHSLELYKTQVTGVGCKHLVELKNLHTLILWSSNVTDAGLKEVARLKGLQSLDLHDTPVTDIGLMELIGLPNLKALKLGETKITDAGLIALAKIKTLQSLDLAALRVTDAGVKDLKQALPRCRIRR